MRSHAVLAECVLRRVTAHVRRARKTPNALVVAYLWVGKVLLESNMYELLNAECALCIQSCKVRRISVCGGASVRGSGRAGVLGALGVNRISSE